MAFQLISAVLSLATSACFCQSRSHILIICVFHSFIHTEHLYSASARGLLRGAPDSSMAKKSSLKLGKKRRCQGSRQSPKLRREPIPDTCIILLNSIPINIIHPLTQPPTPLYHCNQLTCCFVSIPNEVCFLASDLRCPLLDEIGWPSRTPSFLSKIK